MQALVADPIARCRPYLLSQSEVITAIRRWQSEGRSVSSVSGRWLVLRSAISWAVAEGIGLHPRLLVGFEVVTEHFAVKPHECPR